MSIANSYKSAENFISQCIHTVVSLFKIIFISSTKVILPQAPSGKCIVLGNGPSLKQSLEKHSSLFEQYPLVCVNTFAITKEYTELKPSYYVILDFSFWKSENEVLQNTLKHIAETTSWKMNLLVPQIAAQSGVFEKICSQNKNITLNYYNYTVFKGFDKTAHFFYAKNMAMPQSQNVLVAAIFLSVNMGFKEIMVVGADHTWHEQLHVNEQNQVCTKHVHFYDHTPTTSYVPFYKGAHLQETFTMAEIFTTWAKVFTGYEALNRYAMKKNAKIVNASEISFIDAFERVKL